MIDRIGPRHKRRLDRFDSCRWLAYIAARSSNKSDLIRSMITRICQKCDSEMKLIPAGFSRTKNKPYSAFWSCDKRNGGCGETARAEADEAGSQVQAAGQDRLAAIERKLDQIIELLKSA